MKKKGLLLVTSMLLVSIVAGAGVAYALWRNEAKSEDNTVKVGEAVTLTFGQGAGLFFSDVELEGPNTETSATEITVLNPSEETYVLKIADVRFSDDEAVESYDATDLYVKVGADQASALGAAPVKFENGVELIASNSTASKTVYVVIGIGANTSGSMAGQTITFSIVTAAA